MWHIQSPDSKRKNDKTISETGCNNEPENNPTNQNDNLPEDVVVEKTGDSWNDAFRPDFIFKPENINRLDDFDRFDHDDAFGGRGFGGGSRFNPYQAPPSGGNDRKRPAAGSSGSRLMPSRKHRR